MDEQKKWKETRVRERHIHEDIKLEFYAVIYVQYLISHFSQLLLYHFRICVLSDF